MNLSRNIWFDLCADEPALTIAPVRIIEVTDAVRAADAAKQAARTVRITWTRRLSVPNPHAHKPSHVPRQPHNPDRSRPCKGCAAKVVSRSSKSGLCRTCKATTHRPTFDPSIHHGACRRGHAFTPENTMLQSSGARRCRECRNARSLEWSRQPEVKKKAIERKTR